MTGRAIFESDIQSWSTPTTLQSRLDRWCLAGFDTVILQSMMVNGATWSTTAWGLMPASPPGIIYGGDRDSRARGLRVVACVCLAPIIQASHTIQTCDSPIFVPILQFLVG